MVALLLAQFSALIGVLLPYEIPIHLSNIPRWRF